MSHFEQLKRICSSTNRQQAHVAGRPKDLLLPSEIERLESRMMLAGDVTFKVSGDNLTVVGTGAADCVGIGIFGDQIVVNGEPTGISAGDLNNLTIKTLGGDDVILIGGNEYGIEIGGNLKIVTKAGEDDIRIFNTLVSGKTTIKTGNDGDTVTTQGAIYNGKVKVVTGEGNDRVSAAVIQSGNVNSRSSLDALASTFNVSFERKVKLKLGAGNDQLSLGVVSMNDSALPIVRVPVFSVSFSGGLSADGGSGQDVLRIAGSTVDPDSLPAVSSVQTKNFESPVNL